MFVLDTDHLTIMERGGSSALSLEMRLDRVEESQLTATIVSYDEQMRGWLSRAARASTSRKMIEVYALLETHIETFQNIRILPFDEEAAMQYDQLITRRIRIGSMDLRIASIALTQNATLLTRNLSDFNKVPGLKVEDWSF